MVVAAVIGVIGRVGGRTFVLDVVLAAGVAAVDIGQAVVAGTMPGAAQLSVVGVLLLVGQSAPLIWRRQAPVAVWIVVGILAAAYGIGPYPDRLLPLAPLVALYAVLVDRSWRSAALIGLLSLALALASAALAGDSDAQDYLSGALLVGMTMAVAASQRARRAYLAELEAKTEHLERVRAAEARQAAQ